MKNAYRYIGKVTPRKDAVDIVTGRAEFLDDINIDDMLIGKVLRSPHPHANIKDIDTTKAINFRGVSAVLTYHNVPDWKTGLPPHARVLDSKVRFVGDAVALVAAESEEVAEEAIELIEVTYEVLPAVYGVKEAVIPEAPQLYEQFSRNTLTPGCPIFGPNALEKIVIGNVKKGFEDADITAEGTYAYENLPNALPMEPPGLIAKWEGPNELIIWSATQSPYMHRVFLQPSMGFPDIRSIGVACGGSYGTKNYYSLIVFYAAALAREAGKPVKIYYTKDEQFRSFVVRLGSRIDGKIGIKKDGTVTAISGTWFVNTGSWSDLAQGQVAVGCGEAQLMLRCSNWDFKPKVICTNRTGSGIVRGFGGQELKCALTPLVSLALEEANIDPVQFFKKNYVKPGDEYYWRDGELYRCRGVDFSTAIDRGAETFRWREKWKGWGKPTMVDGPRRRGVGVGIHGNADVGEDYSEAYVQLRPDGTAIIYSCLSEPGIGQRNSVCKMVAEILNLPLERVNVTPPDTMVNPFDFGLVGSRGTYAVGAAVIQAAQDAKAKLFERAALVLKSSPENLETRDGNIYIKDRAESSVPWIAVMDFGRTLSGIGQFCPDYTVPNFMMIFVEVEVDVETGKIDVLNIVPTTDAGQIIDPLSLENQIHGCLGSAGLDSALFEESVLDKTTGRILNGNMIDYKWRTFLELPRIENVILETPFPTHLFGAVGVGEISTAPGPSAILMAVSNAIGEKVYDYPLTPDKILKTLGRI